MRQARRSCQGQRGQGMNQWLRLRTGGRGRNGALGEIRTHDLCLRRAALYPLSYKRVFEVYGVAGAKTFYLNWDKDNNVDYA